MNQSLEAVLQNQLLAINERVITLHTVKSSREAVEKRRALIQKSFATERAREAPSLASLHVSLYTNILAEERKLAAAPKRNEGVIDWERIVSEDTRELRETKEKYGLYGQRCDYLTRVVLLPGALYTHLTYGANYSVPLAGAFLGLWLDKQRHPVPTLKSIEKISSYALLALPTLEFLVEYAFTGEKAMLQHAVNFGYAAFIAVHNGFVLPSYDTRKMSAVYSSRIDNLTAKFLVPKSLRAEMKPVEQVLRIVGEAQDAGLFKHAENSSQQFEEACIGYLEGDVPKSSLLVARKVLVPEKKSGARAQTTVPTEATNPSLPYSVPEAPVIISHNTQGHEYALSLGLVDDDARRIADASDVQSLRTIVGQLQGVFHQNTPAVIESNPGILLLKGTAREEYFTLLYRTLSAINERHDVAPPLELQPIHNPAAFATLDGLDCVLNNVVAPASTATAPASTMPGVALPILCDKRYTNTHLLHAMLTKGFGLGTSSPRIGMRYRPFDTIRSNTYNDRRVNSQDIREFNPMFGHLIGERSEPLGFNTPTFRSSMLTRAF